jgi:hypothetical protein
MTSHGKVDPKRRVRRRVVIFAVTGLMIVCASMILNLSSKPASIEISGVNYEKMDQPAGPVLLAKFAITNNGAPTFSVGIFTPDYVRFETERGWTKIYGVEMIEPKGVIAMPTCRTWRWLNRGEGFFTEATFPQSARRWQPVYEVNVLSDREKWKRRLPKLLSFKRYMEWKLGNIFPGNWISDEYRTEFVFGPVIEITNVASTPELSLDSAH